MSSNTRSLHIANSDVEANHGRRQHIIWTTSVWIKENKGTRTIDIASFGGGRVQGVRVGVYRIWLAIGSPGGRAFPSANDPVARLYDSAFHSPLHGSPASPAIPPHTRPSLSSRVPVPFLSHKCCTRPPYIRYGMHPTGQEWLVPDDPCVT
jgi:hypothetical protein